jgi:hypothetical protein
MDELIIIMREIRDQLAELNNKIDRLTSFGSYDLTSICNKLDIIDTSLDIIDTTISIKD